MHTDSAHTLDGCTRAELRTALRSTNNWTSDDLEEPRNYVCQEAS